MILNLKTYIGMELHWVTIIFVGSGTYIVKIYSYSIDFFCNSVKNFNRFKFKLQFVLRFHPKTISGFQI